MRARSTCACVRRPGRCSRAMRCAAPTIPQHTKRRKNRAIYKKKRADALLSSPEEPLCHLLFKLREDPALSGNPIFGRLIVIKTSGPVVAISLVLLSTGEVLQAVVVLEPLCNIRVEVALASLLSLCALLALLLPPAARGGRLPGGRTFEA